MNLRSGFKLGNWVVYPLEGRLVGEVGERRVQPKSMDVLLYLAENAGAVVEREAVLRHVWGERAQSDEPLTRCIGELRRALGDTRTESDYILTIPKRGYQLLVPVSMVAADTTKIEDVSKLAARRRILQPDTLKKIGVAGVILLSATLIEVLFERTLDKSYLELGSDESPDSEAISAKAQDDHSVVVLPFTNLSDDASNEYFSDGISEELLNLLARIRELRVISRTSAFSYKGKNVALPTIAEQLNVAYVLEGSVRKAGNQVRISTQLIDARTDTHLWSENYERTLGDIFTTQDEIAAAVVAQLKITLLGDVPTVQAADPEAFGLVLQARYLGRQSTPESLKNSIALYKEALAIDPSYAAAWAGLALVYTNQAGQALLPFDEGSRLAREAASQALALDPANGPAHGILGWIARSYDRDLMAAARHFERALAMDLGNSDIIAGAANLAASLGRMHQAIALAEYAVARDPLSSVAHANLGMTYRDGGRLDEAITVFRTTLTLSPDYIGVQYFMGTALLLRGEPELALASMQAETLEAWRLIGLATVHHALGQSAASDAALATSIDKHGKEWAYNIAYVFAFRGEPDQAFEWLDKAVAYDDPGLAEIAVEPQFANIHSDPRWLPFLERIGKSPEQLAAIEFKVTLPD